MSLHQNLPIYKQGYSLLSLASGGLHISKKLRYTRVKCLITRRISGRSPRQLVAFFTSIASMDVGGESGNTSRLAYPRLLTPTSTSSLNNGVVGLKDSIRSIAMTALAIGTTAIRQFDNLYSLNDLHKASGNAQKHRPKYFIILAQTKALIDEIQKGGITPFHVIRGSNGGTYVCRELVIAYASWINAQFHLTVIRAFLDGKKSKTKPLATPNHFFYPKFKSGDLCRLRSCSTYPELKGLTVAILRDAEIHENMNGKCWVGYETDLMYRGTTLCAHEISLTKIGEVELPSSDSKRLAGLQ